MTERCDQAIVLQTKNYGEADRIATLFLKGEGKRMAIAKGARRSKKRFGATLEIGSIVDLTYKDSPHRDWLFLLEASSEVQKQVWRKSWEGVVIASYCLELVSKMLPEGQESERKFIRVKDFLTSFKEEIAIPSLFQFEWDWLSLSGWHPDLNVCGICGEKWKEEVKRGGQVLFDHYWEHLLPKPLASRQMLGRVLA